MTVVQIWFFGELERILSDLELPTDVDAFFETPVEWDSEFLPNTGDEIDWFSFVNSGNISDKIIGVLSDLSYNSYVVKKMWKKTRTGIFCALNVDIYK